MDIQFHRNWRTLSNHVRAAACNVQMGKLKQALGYEKRGYEISAVAEA